MSTHYEVLGLSTGACTNRALTPQLIKAAYRRALLQYHPDKVHQILPNATANASNPSSSSPLFSVDQITKAYSVISTPKLRAEYDRELALQPNNAALGNQADVFRTGVEIVDLDDLEFDEKDEAWFRGCRCGDDRGFLFREEDLEEAANDGELNVGCKGCSLWLRVLFGVVEGDDVAPDAGSKDEK